MSLITEGDHGFWHLDIPGLPHTEWPTKDQAYAALRKHQHKVLRRDTETAYEQEELWTT